jgi:hypothetical protein
MMMLHQKHSITPTVASQENHDDDDEDEDDAGDDGDDALLRHLL